MPNSGYSAAEEGLGARAGSDQGVVGDPLSRIGRPLRLLKRTERNGIVPVGKFKVCCVMRANAGAAASLRVAANRQGDAVGRNTHPEHWVGGREIDDIDPVRQIGFRQRLGDLPKQVQPERPAPFERQVEIGIRSGHATRPGPEHECLRASRQILTQNVPHDVGVLLPHIKSGRHPRRCRNWSRR